MTDRLKAWLDEQFESSPPDNHGRITASSQPRGRARRLNAIRALRAVVELHAESGGGDVPICFACDEKWPCLTIRTIEKEVFGAE